MAVRSATIGMRPSAVLGQDHNPTILWDWSVGAANALHFRRKVEKQGGMMVGRVVNIHGSEPLTMYAKCTVKEAELGMSQFSVEGPL